MNTENAVSNNCSTPSLVWVRLNSIFFDGKNPTNPFYGARMSNGWLIWNHDNHTLAFVPDPTDVSLRVAEDETSR